MNKYKIEEILSNIQFQVYSDMNFIEPLGLDKETWKELLDYITNLQEENIKIKKYYNVNVNKYEDLLIKYNTIERWYQLNKSRNEKAIEYIELGLANEEEAEELLDILQGSDKE